MSASVLLFFVLGLLLLVAGAEVLVRGASRLAASLGIAPLVIGLTVVAFGTSAPEMAVSVQSALSGQAGADIAIGNVVGSNIFNVLFILGLAAIIAPLFVSQQLIRIDVPIMIGVSILLLLLALDGSISRANGVLLFAGIIAYTAFAIIKGRRDVAMVEAEYAQEYGHPAKGIGAQLINITAIIIGLALLVLGANWLVDGAITLARAFGISELVIGLTIVAAGTSLPEVATSVIASIKGERDIAVGNIVGSNIFNILAVLGLAAIVAPDGINVSSAALQFDIPVMLAVAVACLPIFFSGHLIARWEGGLFFAYYIAYTAYLIMTVSGHGWLHGFENAMLAFVIPLTVITLVVTAWRARME
ncbi:cation:H+ antiporter [Methylohalomonas lacus]|uniref:Cation:H+ antiporter n=1 Tax=Methylohalomonas lacus TaxID=398773 RepID=A0AAE3L248_9GAMM|nr:calcium/sodium antiporter [Methylohalomonas lacus]MCS3903956.1 cation:H+ antiporter [Methylohalomonas lacus]